MFEIRTGDCLDILRGMADSSVDSIVTDPPYGLSFMGKKWDYDVPDVAVWAECLRVLKPGGHLLAFAGTRTQHRMAVRIEDAGFEIRDMIAWVYGSGFPKSLDVSKAIDKAAGAEREVVRVKPRAETSGTMAGSSDTRPWIEKSRELGYHEVAGKDPVTAAAAEWQGWGTALKPALEPITVARRPLDGTVAENVLQWGTGGLNVDGCRVEASDGYTKNAVTQGVNTARTSYDPRQVRRTFEPSQAGRWPANLIHDGSEDVVGLFPNAKGGNYPAQRGTGQATGFGAGLPTPGGQRSMGDDGSAARFFYCAKASKRDRDEGLDGFALRVAGGMEGRSDGSMGSVTMSRNVHPTVKPTDLMRYLCRLVTPPGGLVLDPFAGSGSTGKGALLEGFRFLGIERDPDYARIAQARCAAVQPGLPLSGPPSE